MRPIDADDFRDWILMQKRLSKNYTIMMLDEIPTIEVNVEQDEPPKTVWLVSYDDWGGRVVRVFDNKDAACQCMRDKICFNADISERDIESTYEVIT